METIPPTPRQWLGGGVGGGGGGVEQCKYGGEERVGAKWWKKGESKSYLNQLETLFFTFS